MNEWREQRPGPVLGDPDARVADREIERDRAPVVVDRLHADSHLAPIGEFDGVRRQVADNLAETPRIAAQQAGRSGRHQAGELQPLAIGCNGQHLDDSLQHPAQAEVQAFERHLSRLDLGQIQDMVQQGFQRLRTVAYYLGITPLFGWEVAIEQQPGHADYAIHGGADLVAHVGQEPALRQVGGFGEFFGLDQLLLGCLALVMSRNATTDPTTLPSSITG